MVEVVRAAAVVPWQECVDFAARAFEAAGLPSGQAQDAADALVHADATGTVTHGLKNLRNYITLVTNGHANPKPNIRVVGGSKTGIVMDADNALGHVAAYAGVRKAIEVAKEYGTGNVFVRGSNHYGHSGFWAGLPVRQNMVGFAVTNASAGIAPFGGTEPLIGNNPPAWALPSKVVDPNVALPPAEYEPLLLDIALSVVAANRLDIYRRRGEPIPDTWALDKDGEPTTDPTTRASGGTLAAVGGYKGAGMAIVMSMMTSFIGGTPFDSDRQDPKTRIRYPGKTGHWFQVYDIEQWTDLDEFTRNVREIRDRIEASPTKAGVDRVYAPGTIENEKATRHQAEGIPLEQFTLDDLAWVAEHLGVQSLV